MRGPKRGHVSRSRLRTDASETSNTSGTSASDFGFQDLNSRLSTQVLEEPTQVDLRSICVQVSCELKRSSRRFQKICARGWPLVVEREREREKDRDRYKGTEAGCDNGSNHGSSSMESDGEALIDGNENAKEEREEDEDGVFFRLRMKPAKMDHEEVGSESIFALPSTSNQQQENTERRKRGERERSETKATCEIEKIEKDDEEMIQHSLEGSSLPDSAAALEVSDALELCLVTRGAMRDVENRRRRVVQRQIATALVPHFLVKLYTKMDLLPKPQTLQRKPMQYSNFAKRLRKLYFQVLSEVGEEVGLSRDLILRAMEKVNAKLERTHPLPRNDEEEEQEQEEERMN